MPRSGDDRSWTGRAGNRPAAGGCVRGEVTDADEADPAGADAADPELIAAADAVVSAARPELIDLSHAVHAEPELAFAEFRSVRKTLIPLRERGFHIEAPV